MQRSALEDEDFAWSIARRASCPCISHKCLHPIPRAPAATPLSCARAELSRNCKQDFIRLIQCMYIILLPDHAGEKDLRGGVQLRQKRQIIGHGLDVANGKLPGGSGCRCTRQMVVLQHVQQSRIHAALSCQHCRVQGRGFWHSCVEGLSNARCTYNSDHVSMQVCALGLRAPRPRSVISRAPAKDVLQPRLCAAAEEARLGAIAAGISSELGGSGLCGRPGDGDSLRGAGTRASRNGCWVMSRQARDDAGGGARVEREVTYRAGRGHGLCASSEG